MRYSEFKTPVLKESEAGVTSSASVATVVSPLTVQVKPKKNKVAVIKRS